MIEKSLFGSAGNVWLDYCKLVLRYGKRFHDEDKEIVELLDVLLTFESVDENDQVFKKFADNKLIQLYQQKMQSTEIVKELNSSYGKRLYDQQGVNQIDWVLKRLRSKPETKAATITLLLPNDPGPRIPCLSIIDFKIREGKLHMTAFFRSQNVTKSYANMISVHYLQKQVASELKLPLGLLKFFVCSAHIYESDMSKITKIVSEGESSSEGFS
jgi:thymidylate synthase